MLHAYPTKRGTGVELFGHHDDLESLHETIHFLCGESQAEIEQHEHALAVAYDLRKSFERCRDIRQTSHGELLGTQYAWPYVIFYTSYYRHLAGYKATTKLHQANLNQLEYCIESALLEYDAKVGGEVVALYRSVGDVTDTYYTSYIMKLLYDFLFQSSSGKMRFRRLPALIRSMHQWSSEYQDYAAMLEQQAKKQGCSPRQLRDSRQWGDIQW